MEDLIEMATDTDPREAVHAELARAMEGTIGVRKPAADVLEHARDTARQTATVVGPGGTFDAEVFDQLGDDLPGDLRAWLLELPSFLSKQGREQDGHDLCDLYVPLIGAEYFEAERAIVLLEAGKKEEARAKVDELRGQHAGHQWVLMRGAFVLQECGDLDRAEKDLEQAVEKAREADAREDLRMCYDGLIQFLQDRGESQRAMELSRQMLDEMPEVAEEFRTEQIVRDAPKVGRNDPCPCGSGKKYKKCCLKVA